MLLPDVNVLIYAHIEESTPDHAEYARWLTRLATGPEPFALSVLILSGFVRITTNARVSIRRCPLIRRSRRLWWSGQPHALSPPAPSGQLPSSLIGDTPRSSSRPV